MQLALVVDRHAAHLDLDPAAVLAQRFGLEAIDFAAEHAAVDRAAHGVVQPGLRLRERAVADQSSSRAKPFIAR